MIALIKSGFWLLICSMIIVSYAQEPESLEGNEIAIRLAKLDSSTKPSCNTSLPNQNVQCYDCNTLIYCKTNTTVQCQSLPYCSNSRCVKDMPDNCEVEPGNVCPIQSNNKYYPDANDCYKYYYCDGNQEALEAYSCPVGFPFDYSNQACTRGRPCGVFNCVGKNYALYSTNSSLGVLCNANKIIDGTYIACKNSQQLDDSLSCAAVCLKEGNIPHETDNTRYYRCLASGPWGTLVKTPMKCPGKLIFNENTGTCNPPPS